jgi:hypothetical protein
MPAIDNCEPAVIRALRKAGWHVINRPFALQTGKDEGYVYADLRLRHLMTHLEMIIFEVKCFASAKALLDEFYQAVGQYQFYRTIIDESDAPAPVYLSVPHDVYATFFQKQAVKLLIQAAQIKLIVVNLKIEEIVEWVN